MKKAVIIGASSGIGKALAERLSAEGVILGLPQDGKSGLSNCGMHCRVIRISKR